MYAYNSPRFFILKMSCAIYVPKIPFKRKISFFDGFKNELRHLCRLNRIQIF